MVWVLVIYSVGTYYPIVSYPSEAECEKARSEWVTEPGWDSICMPGIMERERNRRRK